MLDGIGQLLDQPQAKDLLNRLENRDVGSALAAEVELGLLWAINSVTKTQLHPELPTTKRRPEAFCPELFPSAPSYIEISAVSDDTFSDRDKMERAANIISQFANRLRKGSGSHLYFRFNEESGYQNGKYQRFRCITSNFRLIPALEDTLRNWLTKSDWPNPQQVRLTSDDIDVVLEWKSYVHPEGRTFSRMPPIAYDIVDNPVYRRLQDKQSQLSGVPPGSHRCIFLGDAGCNILRDLRRDDPTRRVFNGEQIIWHFLNRSSIDLVAVFSPQRMNNYPIQSPRIWRVTYFDKRKNPPANDHIGLDAVAAALPAPNYEGYQARSLHRQGSFDPQARGQYLGSQMSSKGSLMSISVKLSARLVLEYLAGRITLDQFKHFGGVPDVLDSTLKAGNTIQSARIEKASLDEDDDHIVFELAHDYSASPLDMPATIGKSD
jgi:hypothetical protein